MKEIPLTRGQVAFVDDEDYEYLSKFKWHANYSAHTDSFYAMRNIREGERQVHVSMHRIIMNAKDGEHVDHENHNTTDNRKENMRIVGNAMNQKNQRLNAKNKSGFHGVHWHTRHGKWQANIGVDGRLLHLGMFSDKQAAIAARQEANAKYGFHPNHGMLRQV